MVIIVRMLFEVQVPFLLLVWVQIDSESSLIFGAAPFIIRVFCCSPFRLSLENNKRQLFGPDSPIS
jgi:hypothetical protein